MKYHFNNQITNPEIIIADKVNFFADIFDYFISYLGKPSFPNLENHKSLLEKIRFQLDNFSNHSTKNINSYFKNKYLSSKDPLISEFYKNEWQSINLLKIGGIQTNRKKLLKEINQLITKFDKTLFINALSKIIDCIISGSKLGNDRISFKLEYYTLIIISEFIFSGFPKKDLEKLFDKILSTKVEIQNNKVKTDIPLPGSLLKLKFKTIDKPQVFYNKINNYLKTRTLQQQFEGIYHLYKNSSKEKTFIFYMNNIRALQPIDIQIGDVRFSNQIRKENITKNGIRKEYRAFFNGRGKLFVQTTLNENNDLMGKEKAVRKINNTINYLNACIDKKAYLHQDDFILRDGDQNIRHQSILLPLHSDELEKLAKDNVYDLLKDHESALIKRYFELDKIYFYAITSEFKENKVINYWRFLESFFESEDYKSPRIISSVSSILNKNCQPQFIMDYYNLAYQILWSSYIKYPVKGGDGLNSYLEIPEIELQELMNPGLLDQINFKKLNEILNHPFVNHKLKWFLTTSNEVKTNLAFEFYQNILSETLEQRNFIEHSGIFYDRSLDKILLSLPQIVRDFRSLVVNELTKKQYKNFSEVLSPLNNGINQSFCKHI